MEYKSFRFGLKKVKTQSNRQQISAEEYQRRFDFYKRKFEEEQKALEQAQEGGKLEYPVTETREQPMGTEPERVQLSEKHSNNAIAETGSPETEHLPEATTETEDAQLLEVDRLYLQDAQEPEENIRVNQRHPDKVQSSAQGKKPNH